jgi:hypothetical protein
MRCGMSLGGDMTTETPDLVINGVRYVPAATQAADEVSIHGMYDMHLFHRVTGKTVEEVIANWLAHNSEPQPAMVDGRKVDDMGQSMLCPAIVLSRGKEVRRVGQMVFPSYERRGTPRNPDDLEAYRQALLKDPDITRLLTGAPQ